ncbi:MAG: 1-(5-phosphoribosyl)-5-[(5-phosphoribosylamino)methylideneamino]imidazole-4-carboxamide isomerase [Alphaproteobacteria bacterium]|nr:1-(5-phosphoribosyl)-5-[(5-phosphoribosylamino)methylideneamino]imidazole-4-carboxamide isomerase [Alphaproteobacteria bacterium]
MILYPAIDLKGGQCVRLLRGAMDQATVFNTDPAGQARQFAGAGCAWVHVVDLDGAVAGKAANAPAVAAILAAVNVPVQLGGGIRDDAGVEAWLARGVARVVLGTAALKDPDLVRRSCRKFPDKIAVGVDAREGKVAVNGWTETSDTTVDDLAARFADAGVAALIYTDIDRDGAMQGPNVAATAALSRTAKMPVIASGGVSSLDDLLALRRVAPELDGVICGRALYDGRIELRAAIAALEA